MPIIALLIGSLLETMGFLGYFYSESRSPTALIPAALGTVIVVCGAIALVKTQARKHAMHVAVLMGLLGLIGSAARAIPALLDGKTGLAVNMQLGTAVLCLVFVALCVRSFIAARRSREKPMIP